MQDTFQWTDETVLEFVRFTLHQTSAFQGRYADLEQFKSSKSTKKEWEIVAFGEREGDAVYYYDLQPEGNYKSRSNPGTSLRWPLCKFNGSNGFIHAVRRLSDGEVFSVGDKIIYEDVRFAISKLYFEGATLGICALPEMFLIYLPSQLKKLPQPILTTVDQKDLFSRQDEVWVVSKDNEIIHRYVDTILDHGCAFQDCRFYSTPEAARDYLLNHAPLLSLNDVKEAWASDRSFVGTDWLLEKLTALVKQKLNQ